MKRGAFIAAAALLLGAAFIILGTATGGYTSVLKKAIFICMECIGIG